MILSNYWKWLDLILKTNFGDGTSDYETNILNMSGSNIYMDMSSDSRAVGCRNINSGGIFLGSGNDDITVDDYAMSSDCTSSISNLNYTINSAGTNEGLSRVITITGTNGTANAITITEVGYAKFYNSYNHYNQYSLFSKTKLSEPLTVPSGGSFLINIAWEEV